MNRDDVIRMAIISRIAVRGYNDESGCTPEELVRFAALVAASEREACAKVCDEDPVAIAAGDDWLYEARRCAAAIRARGDT